ncbi:hypothetical protein Tco_0228030 [Tanacetum coccineum]
MPYPRFTKVTINHFLSIHKSVPKALPTGLHTIKDDGVLSRMKFVRIREDVQEYGRAIPDAMLTGAIKQSETYKAFINYSTCLVPQKKTRVSDESDAAPAKRQTGRKIMSKKKVSISVDDNIIPEPYIALELAKSMSLVETAEEEAARQVHATHERIISPDLSHKLKGNQTLSAKEQLAADTMQALKANKKSSRSQPYVGGSSKGTGTKPGVPDEVQGSSIAKADVTLDWRWYQIFTKGQK